MAHNRFFQNTIAIVYDFDGTLSPQPMQEYTVLPKIGVKPKAFWRQVDRESAETVSERCSFTCGCCSSWPMTSGSTSAGRISGRWPPQSSTFLAWRVGS